MSEFKPIETQEELNNIIGYRLKQNEEKVREGFKGYKSPDEVADLQKNFEAELTKLKTASEAEKAGLEDQLKQIESIRADASELAKYTTSTTSTPLAATEVDEGDSTDAALRKLANDLKFD